MVGNLLIRNGRVKQARRAGHLLAQIALGAESERKLRLLSEKVRCVGSGEQGLWLHVRACNGIDRHVGKCGYWNC